MMIMMKIAPQSVNTEQGYGQKFEGVFTNSYCTGW